MSSPQTPRRSLGNTGYGSKAAEVDRYIRELSEQFNLGLELPKDGESPQKRQSHALSDEAQAAQACISKIKFLCYKDKIALDIAVRIFEDNFDQLKKGWVYKPNADPDLLPISEFGRSVRLQVLDSLNRILEEPFQKAKQRSQLTRSISAGEVGSSTSRPDSRVSFTDDPIPFPITPASGKKRQSDEFVNLNTSPKKQRGRDEIPSSSQGIINAVEAIPVKSIETKRNKLRQTLLNFQTTKPPVTTDAEQRPLDDGIQVEPKGLFTSETANTSFTSNITSIFSQQSQETVASTPSKDGSDQDLAIDDMKVESPGRTVFPNDPNGDEENYGSSLGPDDFIDIELSQPFESFEINGDEIRPARKDKVSGELENRLQNVFPELPACLNKAPLCIRYEITRMFLNAGVPMTDLKIDNLHELTDYNKLWDFLRNCLPLKGKAMPEKSSLKAWEASLKDFRHQTHDSVIVSATLRFNDSATTPLFSVHLHPLKLELAHRLSRRFGSDRFLEVAVPSLSGSKVPKVLQDAGEDGYCQIIKWLVRGSHTLLGLRWEAFCVKDVTKRQRAVELGSFEEPDNSIVNRIHFFATDGLNFESRRTIPLKNESPLKHTRMTRTALLNWLIPLEKNQNQRCLKLFSRISLGLSKTYATVVLNRTEIRYKEALMSEDGKEDMADGAGQISKRMAIEIAASLNLSHVPSAFQARIGGAKGLWTVDVTDSSNKRWIDIYPSQVKWETKNSRIIQDFYDEDHRTFEVLRWSNSLTSASLNLQLLPLLEDRGKSKSKMRQAISKLLKDGLYHEIMSQRAAMDSPQAFRKWVRDTSPSIKERLQHGQVLYRAGLPAILEERLNMLLDAGFDPKKLEFLKELAWESYTKKCRLLQTKLNISVGRSTYVYMAVDFTGTLQPDEVHLGFSTSFDDEVSGFSEVLLTGMDVLVARSPAHYTSDVQRVKAVFKPELMALKDVVVFSSKGNFPLAKKLSGGDYDGDIAWVCWEPSIVSNFQNAEVPVCPDLVKLGHITQDQATYADLMNDDPSDTTTLFLEKGFEFNLRPRFLGICSNFKESYCYTQNNVSRYEAVFLSTLLSSLVDSAKQGYSFSEGDWEKIKRTVIVDKPRDPNYKKDSWDGGSRCEHIIDYLKFSVAKDTIDKYLAEFWKSLPPTDYKDEDLVKLGQLAKGYASSSPEWNLLIKDLEHDITDLKNQWTAHFANNKARNNSFNGAGGMNGDNDNIGLKAEWFPILMETYRKWRAIRPFSSLRSPPSSSPTSPSSSPTASLKPSQTLLLQSLTTLDHPDSTRFELIKASLAYTAYPKAKFVWWMAGRQLAFLKAMYGPSTNGSDPDNSSGGGAEAGGAGAGFGAGLTPITPQMYAMLKPDATYVRLLRSEENDPRFWEARAESEMPELDEGQELEEEKGLEVVEVVE